MAIRRADFPLPDVDEPLVAGYFAAARCGEVAIPRCDGCGAWCWYPAPTCPTCGAGAFTWTVTAGRGRLFSWAVVRRAFLPAFAERVPFVTALVALEEDPAVRLVSYVVDVAPETLVADEPLVATCRELAFPTVPGRSVTVPMFTRAPGAP